MTIHRVERDPNASVGHVGLAVIYEMARICGLNDLCQGLTILKQPRFSDAEIFRQRFQSLALDSSLFDRLPSEKFVVNHAFLFLGMLVYNMLKVVGRDMVFARALGLKKATRRRMKTVMRSIMLMCGRIVHHARQLTLRLSCTGPWYAFFAGLLGRLQAV